MILHPHESIDYSWYFFITMLFFLDICAFSLLNTPLFCIILTAYIFQLFQPIAPARLGFLLFLISLESLLWYGVWAVQLLICIPLALVALQGQYMLYLKGLQKYGVLIGALLLNSFVIEYYLLGLTVVPSYTIYKIVVNILVLWFFSLK